MSARPAAVAAPRLLSLATAVPGHRVSQAEARSAVERWFAGTEAGHARMFDVLKHSGIEHRHFCMPLDWYATERSFKEQNALYVEHALRLGEEAASRALRSAGLEPADLDHILFVSTTGLATPSLDVRLSLALGCRQDCRRTPVWGLGCAGGAAGLARARDLALADPLARVLLVAVELCSLTFRRGDLDKRNLVAASLFADGAAAVVVAGAEADASLAERHPLELQASRSTLWPETLDVMGWEVSDRGLHVVFSRDIPAIVRERIRPFIESFLHEEGLSLSEVAHLVAHPGGAKVLAAFAEALAWPESGLTHAREVLRTCGNMSSPSCLFVLERFLASGDIRAGEHAVVLALGPGFAAEAVLLRGAVNA